ncbi:MAG: CRISPR system precrRNA processing endoribonuclease RAMP protein Cas6 [Thermodesulfobacteriota bacterium]|nr:CRISPR system precrRNA processing endoribonuclease RAMP protein Cas6 [Thermodesulfobacteriota bacterium]
MLYGRYIFSCILERDAVLPLYKGSTFRGVFGLSLKKVVCALKRQECKTCLLRNKCVYSLVFETPPIEDNEKGKRIVSPPHPYVIEPIDTAKRLYKKGEPFDFAIIIFGNINDYLPYFVYAIEQMGKIGIGKKIEGRRAGFRLDKVMAENGDIIYSGRDRKIYNGDFCRELLVENLAPSEDNRISSLEITLKTPLRVKFQNKFEASLPFHILTRSMLRRISSLYTYYGNGEPSMDYRGLVDRAKDIKITASSTDWFDWSRYSNRQDRSMLMGGMTGAVTYSGKLGEFMPLIRFCEETHIGKQTTFGLGEIKITKTLS